MAGLNFVDIADKALKEFGKNVLKPNEDELKKGNVVVNQVTKKLKKY